jgi:tetratricopeptide (TPR) repeat protein
LSLKHIVVSVLFVFFSIYVAFLNPHESTFHLTQSQAFKLPTVILLLAAVLTGVVISVAMFWAFNLKNVFSRWKIDFQKSRVEKKHSRLEILFKKAENFFLCGRLDKTSAVLDKILDAEPNHMEALNLKGKTLCAEGKNSQAIHLQKKALEEDPQNISVLFDLATTYGKADQTDDEINLLKKIHRENPKAAQPLFRLRDTYIKKQDWKNILIAQDKILPLIRNNKEEWDEELKNKSRFLYARGKQQWEQDRRDIAISDFKQALKAWSENFDAHLFLGDAYLETGKTKTALKKWISGFEQTRNTLCLIRAQKVIYLEKGDPQELIQIYQKAIDPKQPQESYKYILLLAVLYLEHGQAENAKNILEENQTDHELLGSLLLAHARQPANNGSNFDLIKEAIFAHSTP